MSRRSKRNTKGKRNQVRDNLFISRVPPMKDYSEAIIPPRKMIHFKHNALGVINTAAVSVAKRWHSNSVYRPDPTVSAACSQFATWAAFYSQYRVIQFRYKVTAVNNEALPVAVGVYSGSEDPTTSATIDVCRQPLSRSTLVGSISGMSRTTFRGTYPLTEIYGEANIGEDYAALISANPADIAYFALVCQTSSGSNFSAGVAYELEFDYYVEMFGRNKLA